MRKVIALLVAPLFGLALLSSSALAAVRTVTLSVPGMYCAVCPITVKKALQKVPGVTGVDVSLEKKAAVVSYDDTRTSIAKMQDATFEAGYPSELQKGKIQ